MSKSYIQIIVATLLLLTLYSFTSHKQQLDVKYKKDGKLISEKIPLDFIDSNGNFNSPYIDSLKFGRFDSIVYINHDTDHPINYLSPIPLDFSKAIKPYSPEYYSVYTAYFTTKALEYYNSLFDNKIDFDFEPEYRTISIFFGDFPGLTQPNSFIYEENSDVSPSIAYHEAGHRAFWYLQDEDKGLGIKFKGLTVVHMGLLEYFTMSLNNSPLVGEGCLPDNCLRDANDKEYKYPLSDYLKLRKSLELLEVAYAKQMKDSTSTPYKMITESYISDKDYLDKVYDNHRGGMVLASTLWHIRETLGQEKTDKLIAQTILNLNQYMDERSNYYSKQDIESLPQKIDWCDVFYGLVQQDKKLYKGKDISVIALEFEKTGYPTSLVAYN